LAVTLHDTEQYVKGMFPEQASIRPFVVAQQRLAIPLAQLD
jgi:hypothetical protein